MIAREIKEEGDAERGEGGAREGRADGLRVADFKDEEDEDKRADEADGRAAEAVHATGRLLAHRAAARSELVFDRQIVGARPLLVEERQKLSEKAH